MLAAVGEALVVPGELDDLHRFFERLAVDAVVFGRHVVVAGGHDGAERPRLAGHGATADAELHAATGEDVGQREVLRQPQRMPLRHHVEHLAEAQLAGAGGGVHTEQDEIGEDLVALVLEVVLGEPHRVVAQPVGRLRPVQHVVVTGDHIGIAVTPGCGRHARVAGVGHRHRAEEVRVDTHGYRLLRGQGLLS